MRDTDRSETQTDRSERKCQTVNVRQTGLTLCFILAQLAKLSLQRLWMVTLQAERQVERKTGMKAAVSDVFRAATYLC